MNDSANLDQDTIHSFGQEWSRFTQTNIPEGELAEIFSLYFSRFPWESLPRGAVGFDAGCGSGRWARYVAPRVGRLICVDASREAADVATRNLSNLPNCEVYCCSIEEIPLPDGSADFGYSLGVLHHIPDTLVALKSCAKRLKRGAPFLVYLYYALETRSALYRFAWKGSDIIRRHVSGWSPKRKALAADLLAGAVYYPLSQAASLLKTVGLTHSWIPLSFYSGKSFQTMRTDAFDRFCTPLEKRFTRDQIRQLLQEAGFQDVEFSLSAPYWCATATKR